MSSKELFREYFRIDPHIHTSDGSSDARATVWEWEQFFSKNLPWVESLIVTNHAHMPNQFDSKVMSKDIVLPNYSGVQKPKVFTGIEANILHDGTLDVSNHWLDETPWVLAAVNPMFQEYGENKGINLTGKQIETNLVAAIETEKIDALGHPVYELTDAQLADINWDKIFHVAQSYGVFIEINLNIENPNWWTEALIRSNAPIILGSDWHGLYHFRRYRPHDLNHDEEELWNKVAYGDRKNFDQLNHQKRSEYNRLYTQNTVPDELFDWFGTELQRAASIGLQPENVFNSYGLSLLDKYIKLEKSNRRKYISSYAWRKTT